MEEEGIFYYFQHSEAGHKMVVCNDSSHQPDLPTSPSILYNRIAGGNVPEGMITGWEKSQELRAGKYALRDYKFEMPDKNFDTDKSITTTVTVGKETHKLLVAGNDKLVIYDSSAEVAKRYDGIDKSGGEQASMLAKIGDDVKRTVEIRPQMRLVTFRDGLPSSNNCKSVGVGSAVMPVAAMNSSDNAHE